MATNEWNEVQSLAEEMRDESIDKVRKALEVFRGAKGISMADQEFVEARIQINEALCDLCELESLASLALDFLAVEYRYLASGLANACRNFTGYSDQTIAMAPNGKEAVLAAALADAAISMRNAPVFRNANAQQQLRKINEMRGKRLPR